MKSSSAVLTLFAGLALGSSPSPAGRSIHIPLADLYNNKGFSSKPGEAALNPLNDSFPADAVSSSDGFYTSSTTGISYLFPGYDPDPKADDNVICAGQTIPVPPSEDYFSVSLLLTSDTRSTTISGNLTLLYSDGTNSSAEVRAHAFWWFLAIRRGEITYPYFHTANGTNGNASHIYERWGPVEAGKTLEGIVLPNTTNSTEGRLHIFSMSLWEAAPKETLQQGVEVQGVRPRQELDDQGQQLIEVLVNHVGDECVSNLEVSLASGCGEAHAVAPAVVKRICPGDQKRVDVSVVGASNSTAVVSLSTKNGGHPPQSFYFSDVSIGIHEYTASAASLKQHEAPQWMDNGKFGIFIHWGPYSVPSWGNYSENAAYAEWFWWYSTRVREHAAADRSGFNAYRLRTYGPHLFYDDFFPNFTASAFDPKAWVDLFADAGAKYFVLTTKHHDGFALFDTGESTNRSSLHYGPRRDLLGELFDAAAEHQPHLKRGTYFSIPEWFNPDWAPYGFTQFDRPTSTSHPGIIARNPYTNETEPYTGRVPIDDFIADLMVPQMEALAYRYNSDIMWCDAGASNGTDAFAAAWFNSARAQGRHVAINDRCGSPWAADYDTPEYATFSVAQRRKWESNQGMDPFSYGFNRATKDDEYMKPDKLVRTLVDMISKNGNLLLNVGPRADGTIHDVMVKNLRDGGAWIQAHEQAIYNTTYWHIASQDVTGSLRFTQSDDAFYIFSLEELEAGERLVVEVESHGHVPALEGDRVVALGMDGETEVEWGFDDMGRFWIEVSDEVVEGDKYAWVFMIEYQNK